MAPGIVRVELVCAECGRAPTNALRWACPSPSTRLCAECLDRGALAVSDGDVHGCPACGAATASAVCPACWAAATEQLARARAESARSDAQWARACEVCGAATVSRGHRVSWCPACVERFRLEAGAAIAVPSDGPRCAFCEGVVRDGFGAPPDVLCAACAEEARDVYEGTDQPPDAEAAASASRFAKLRACSFCGRAEHETAVLVQGPTVAVCDVCLRECAPGVARTTRVVPSRAAWAQCSFNGISAGERGDIYVGDAGSICELCADCVRHAFVVVRDRARTSRLRVAARDAAPCLLCRAAASSASVMEPSGASVCSSCLYHCGNRWTMPHRLGRFCALCRTPESTAGRLAGMGDHVVCRRCLDESSAWRRGI